MKIAKFIKDRIFRYAIGLITLVVCLLFLLAFRVKLEGLYIVSTVLVLSFITIEVWEFYRKSHFYNKLTQSLEQIDKKYLIVEMVETPEFYEGKIIVEVLREANKSMAEQVATYRNITTEFQEYIELWVHEAKTPLTSLQLMCYNNSEIKSKMLIELNKLDDYIDNVLYYTRSGVSEKDYIIKETNLKNVFEEVLIKNQETLRSLGVVIESEGLNTKVTTDSKWLGFILGQLLANSIKYKSPTRPLEVSVRAEENSEKTVLYFRDNGLGIPAKDLPYIFEKSFTGENGRNSSRSTGMGLYIIKRLLQNLGHKIEITSEQDAFTEVALHFSKNDFYSELV